MEKESHHPNDSNLLDTSPDPRPVAWNLTEKDRLFLKSCNIACG